MIKRLDKSYNKEISEMNEFAFQFEHTEQERLDEINTESDDHILGFISDDRLAAKVHILSFTAYVAGKPFKMAGIGAVATWPEYRRQGMIKKLLFQSLKEMKASGQTISFLAPFSFPFYRKYGWELAFTNKKYQVPIAYFKRDWQAKGYLQRIKPDIPLLDKIYQTFAKQYTGMLVREHKWWRDNILSDAGQIAVAYSEAGDPEGYIMYKVKDNTLTIKDFAYSSLNGQTLLLEFIANHDASVNRVDVTVPEDDQLALLLDQPTFEQKINHYFMARIVDLPEFLKQFPFETHQALAPVTIAVDDSFFPENSGVYQLSTSDSGVIVEKLDQSKANIQATIQTITMLFLGYKRPFELYQLGLIQGDAQAIQQLESYLPNQQTYITPADHF